MTQDTVDHALVSVRFSTIHGNGVFAVCNLNEGQVILEYLGERITAEEADHRFPKDPNQPFHTFYFAISNDLVIDGDIENNPAKWINHSCNPNCQSYETDAGRVYIETLRPILAGEELLFDYNLVIDLPLDEELKSQYACFCGAPNCRNTMLQITTPPAQEMEE